MLNQLNTYTMKRLILSTVCILLCATGSLAQTLIDGIYYNLKASTQTASVTNDVGGRDYSGSNFYSGNITIPSTVTYNGANYSVTSIGIYAFYDCDGLTSVTIPNSVTSIGGGAFNGCSGLESITIPNSVTRIGGDAFYGCTGLTSIEIPNSVTTIESSAFSGCSGLTSITIPNSVTSIGNGAFYGTAWYNNQPDGVVYAGKVAYKYKGTMPSNSTSIVLKDGTIGIADVAFQRCRALTGIEIPNSVTRIEDGAFRKCEALTSITIPNSVTSIGERAFSDCSGLTSITIPNSVTSIGGYAFNNVKHIIYAGSATGSPWGAIAVNGFVDGDFVFSDNTKKQLIAYIGNGGDVTIPNSVTTIGRSAFKNCTGLTIITIPNSVTTIESSAFSGCNGLTSVTIGTDVTSIGERAFYYCSGLTSINVASGNSVYDSRSNCNAIIETASNTLIAGCQNTIIPNSVTSIGNYAFSGCSGLTSISVPNSVTSIGNSAFYNCIGLTSIIVPCEKYDYFVGKLTGYATIIYGDCTFEVAVNANNEDYGTVTGSGIFKMGQTIQLTTTANEGYRFKAWSDGVTDASREITVTKDTIITANFVALYTIKALASASQGTVSGGGVYEDGETATLVANAKAGYTFTQWVDGNDENPRTVTVNGNKTYTAIFAIDEHNVTLSKNISAAGTVTGDGVYEHNTTVQLTATANEGYRFKGWSDGVTEASREITVTKDTSITANFVALYTIKALASASQGTVIGGGVYEDGETVTLVANPNPGYVFAQWVDGSDENPRNVTVNGNKTYTAYFIEGEQDKYMITWKNWDGRVIKTSEVSYGEVPAFDGEKPTRPDEAGYTFTFNGWSPTIAAASQNAEYTANYIQTATEAEKTTIENEGDISITTTDNTALFTWPENASADTYTLTITRNDEVFCSLTFDGQGRLINLNFPNLRASAEGYQFTVTGLNSGTDYAYDLKAKNGAATVNEYTGEFRTSGDAATAAPEAGESIVETARYDINGRKLNAPTKGVNIVKYSDGSFEKEFVK